MYQRKIEVDGKTYTLTANRAIIKTIYNLAPELLEIKQNETQSGVEAGIDIIANLDILFYDLIKVVHKEIPKETSDKILDKLESECENVSNELLEFAMSSFTQGDQKKKKSMWKK